jgi:hypothetical protein
MPDANGPLLRATLQHVETHPGEWEPDDFRTPIGMCFGARACVLAGGVWVVDDPDSLYGDQLIAQADDPPDSLVHRGDQLVISVYSRAKRILGLDERQAVRLFAAGNTLPDIHRIVTDICGDGGGDTPDPPSPSDGVEER